MSGADFFGLVVTVLVIGYLFYALIRGENSDIVDFRGAGRRSSCSSSSLTALAFPLGTYMAKVYTGERVFLSPILGPSRAAAVQDPEGRSRREQDWKSYAKSLMIFSLAGWLLLYVILRTQNTFYVPHALNPLGYHSAPWNVTFNTVSSFLTNTNWQYYGGETTMSYLSQMIGLTVQNWLSAGVGIVVAVALIRGSSRAAARASAISGRTWCARSSTCLGRSRCSARSCSSPRV